jgi:hypothetical protein
MSIKQTKEQIAAYPTYDGWVSLHSGDDSNPTVLPISRLIALASSHTALLEAAKAGFAELHILRTINGLHTKAVDQLESAIQRAEQAEGEG